VTFVADLMRRSHSSIDQPLRAGAAFIAYRLAIAERLEEI
jgi:hypothetical protein